MDRLSFQPVPGVTGYQTEKLVMELDGPTPAIKGIKKYLTIEDKSVKWKLNRTKKRLKKLKESRDKMIASGDFEGKYQKIFEKNETNIAFCEAQIVELTPKLIIKYYDDAASGRISVPIGMWWIPETIHEDFHLNRDIAPVLIDGLRDYQVELVKELLRFNRATGVLATGLGKSIVIGSLCKSFQAAGKRACVVVPTQDLVDQMYDLLSGLCGKDKVTRASSKFNPTYGSDVLITTAASAKKWVGAFHCILIDESHHSAADTWVELLLGAEEATHVYNLTATPFRSDGKDLAIHAFGGPVVYERDVRWGIANKWLEDFDVYTIDLEAKIGNKSVVLPDTMIAAKAYKTLMSNPAVMSAITQVAQKLLAGDRMTMVMFKTVAAGKSLSKLLMARTGRKFDVASATYKKPLKDFQKKLSQFLISNEKLIGEGISVNEVDSVIVGTNHSASAMTLQIVGRALRPKDGPDKKRVVVVDVRLIGYDQFERAAVKRDEMYAWMTGRVPQKLKI